MLIFVIIHILVVHLLPFPCNYLIKVLVWVVTSVQIDIITPSHFGATFNSPFASDWRDAHFQNYNKMLASETFSALILRSSVPSHKTILRPGVTCKVKDTSTPNQYDLYAWTCADSSTQCANIDFTDSYSPVASIDSLCSLLNLATSE
jgi:hypothetical protein